MSTPLLILTPQDVLNVSSSLSPDLLMLIMAKAFYALSTGAGVISPQRMVIDNDASQRRTLFMPTHAVGYGTAVKVVSLSTATVINPVTQGRPGLNASTLVIDDGMGAFTALLNARHLTSLRTAAGSCLATKLLLKKCPSVIVAFGSGGQIFAHLQLLLTTYASIKECIVVNRSRNERLLQLRETLQKLHPATAFHCIVAAYTNTQDANVLRQTVLKADIICAATPSTEVLFDCAWIKADTHINLVGSYTPQMQEVDSKLLSRAAKIVVDSRDACAHEAGELIRANLSPESIVEIGELVDAVGAPITRMVGQAKAGEVTIFKSVGVGIQDVAIAKVVLERALEQGIGTTIHNFNDP